MLFLKPAPPRGPGLNSVPPPWRKGLHGIKEFYGPSRRAEAPCGHIPLAPSLGAGWCRSLRAESSLPTSVLLLPPLKPKFSCGRVGIDTQGDMANFQLSKITGHLFLFSFFSWEACSSAHHWPLDPSPEHRGAAGRGQSRTL